MPPKKPTHKGFLPGYYASIRSKECRERYEARISLIHSVDPYKIPKNDWEDCMELWPNISYINVGMYLLFSVSSYSQDELMNYKSLLCYQNFANGWVREVLLKEFGDNRLMIAKVNHSQKMSEKPLTPWVICEKEGKILFGRCDCMAGLGESCSHVISVS
ncbi:uncharacterized protein LOC124458051 [Xenia sp. Carnegie-2017]|uniref:uncharacterized protein LOC124458051 n=1 Tax=Xenia sp. Carnegie-2017 TaxID=2897299 RepID=UPI001F03CA0F|nr:uncharacterized protein LOC124458051 [Xenia sp. Carnegie-2017]